MSDHEPKTATEARNYAAEMVAEIEARCTIKPPTHPAFVKPPKP